MPSYAGPAAHSDALRGPSIAAHSETRNESDIRMKAISFYARCIQLQTERSTETQ